MIPRRYRILFWAAPVLVLQWIVIAVIELDGRGRYEYVTIGFFFGSFFGHTTLAAAWAALGPGPIGCLSLQSLFPTGCTAGTF